MFNYLSTAVTEKLSLGPAPSPRNGQCYRTTCQHQWHCNISSINGRYWNDIRCCLGHLFYKIKPVSNLLTSIGFLHSDSFYAAAPINWPRYRFTIYYRWENPWERYTYFYAQYMHMHILVLGRKLITFRNDNFNLN